MILVDSSVWVDYFRNAEKSFLLEELINQDMVITNDIVLCELLPLILHRQEYGLAESLRSLNCPKHDIFWEGIRSLQQLNLSNGLNKMGIPDLIIAQQCIVENHTLWTLDKHFYIMSEFTSLKLFKV